MIWIFLSVFANTTATIFLKISSLPAVGSSYKWSEYVYLIAALFAYLLAFLSYRQSLFHFQVGFAYATITSLTAIVIGFVGVAAFGDIINVTKLIGFVLICAGIAMLASSSPAI
jgi:multidrug transporter EmrE-like cation transporter